MATHVTNKHDAVHSADVERKDSKKNVPKKTPRKSKLGDAPSSPAEHIEPVVLLQSEAEQPPVSKPVVKFREKKPTSPPSGATMQGSFHRKSVMLSPSKKASNRLGVLTSMTLIRPQHD